MQHSVEQELAENPALEESTIESTPEAPDKSESAEELKTEELDFQEAFDKLAEIDDDLRSTLYSEHTSKLESLEDLEKKHNYKESLLNRTQTLTDYLLWQIQFLEFTEAETCNR